MKKYILGEVTRKNLEKVLNELPELAKQIPSIITDFIMTTYGGYDDLLIKDIKENHKCNTFGCLLGNISRLYPFDLGQKDETYEVTFLAEVIFPDIEQFSPQWNFLFDTYWSSFQPTFEEAINRIKYFLDVDGQVEGFNYVSEPENYFNYENNSLT